MKLYNKDAVGKKLSAGPCQHTVGDDGAVEACSRCEGALRRRGFTERVTAPSPPPRPRTVREVEPKSEEDAEEDEN